VSPRGSIEYGRGPPAGSDGSPAGRRIGMTGTIGGGQPFRYARIRAASSASRQRPLVSHRNRRPAFRRQTDELHSVRRLTRNEVEVHSGRAS
jgi:hypothetical protein